MLILIGSEYVQSEMRKGVTFGNSLPLDIFSHIHSEKGLEHFVSKVKVKKVKVKLPHLYGPVEGGLSKSL